MQKLFRIILITILISLFIILPVAGADAVSYLVLDGFTYQTTGSDSVMICGYDDRDLSLLIPDKLADREVTEIDKYAFMNHTALTDVSFENVSKLSKIGIYAFANCSSLKSIVLSDSVTDISASVFQGCTSLENVYLANSIKTIPNQTFFGCSKLENIVIPPSVQSIGAYAFSNCSSLTKVSIPKNIVEIDDTAFNDCSNVAIEGYIESFAYKYAVKHKIKFINISNYILGDVVYDENVNIIDATEIQKYIAELSDFTDLQVTLADTDKNERVDITDVTRIQKYIVGLIPSLD